MIEGQFVTFVHMNSQTCIPLYNGSEVGYQAFFIRPLVEILAKIV